MLDEYPPILTAEQVRTLLDISRNTLYGYLRSGEIKAFRIGSIWKIPKKSLIDFCENRMAG